MPAPHAPEAVIVAGGFGTRMLPLTERRPKHLLEVGGVPFLEHQLTKLADAGVGHVVLATSYHADMFAPVLGDGARYGLRLSYVQEEEPLGTGGAIRNVAAALDPEPDHPVVVLNGDVLSGHDLRAQLADFAPRPRRGTRRHLPAPGGGGRRPRLRLRADRRQRPGGRLRREVRRPAHQPGQRRLLRLPALGDRHHPGRAGGLGGAGDLPGPGRRRRARRGLRRDRLLARRRVTPRRWSPPLATW